MSSFMRDALQANCMIYFTIFTCPSVQSDLALLARHKDIPGQGYIGNHERGHCLRVFDFLCVGPSVEMDMMYLSLLSLHLNER